MLDHKNYVCTKIAILWTIYAFTEDLYANLSFANKSDFLAWFKDLSVCDQIEYSYPTKPCS